MALQETHVYIPSSGDDVATLAQALGHFQDFGDEKLVLFGGQDPDTAPYALLEDEDDNGQWCTLLVQGPKDVAAIARALIDLKIDPALLRCSKDWEGNPLVDLDAVKASMLGGVAPGA